MHEYRRYQLKLPDLGLQETEHKILEAAIDIISKKGFSGARTIEIAKAAGIAEGTLFRHFKTKKDILLGIMIQLLNIAGDHIILDRARKILLDSEQKDLKAILKALLLDRLQLFESILPMIRIVIIEALYNEEIRESLFKNVFTKAFEMFMLFRRQMIERELIRPDIDPMAIARTIMGNVTIMVALRDLFVGNRGQKVLDKDLDQVIDVIMFGIAQPTHSESNKKKKSPGKRSDKGKK